LVLEGGAADKEVAGERSTKTRDGCLMRLLIAGARFTYLAVRQAGAAPRWQAIVGRDWWTFNGHGAQ